jgi:hypothetical protein
MEYELFVEDEDGNIFPNADCSVTFSDGTEETAILDEEGKVILKHKVPGFIVSATAKISEGKTVALV